MKYKKTITVLMAAMALLIASAHASSSNLKVKAARLKCINASSYKKAAACYAYRHMKKESGAGVSNQELIKAKKKCLKAPGYRRAADCYRYRMLKKRQTQKKVGKKQEEEKKNHKEKNDQLPQKIGENYEESKK